MKNKIYGGNKIKMELINGKELATGEGKTKKHAEMNAAEEALKRLK